MEKSKKDKFGLKYRYIIWPSKGEGTGNETLGMH